jgi:hypothetical protein
MQGRLFLAIMAALIGMTSTIVSGEISSQPTTMQSFEPLQDIPEPSTTASDEISPNQEAPIPYLDASLRISREPEIMMSGEDASAILSDQFSSQPTPIPSIDSWRGMSGEPTAAPTTSVMSASHHQEPMTTISSPNSAGSSFEGPSAAPSSDDHLATLHSSDGPTSGDVGGFSSQPSAFVAAPPAVPFAPSPSTLSPTNLRGGSVGSQGDDEFASSDNTSEIALFAVGSCLGMLCACCLQLFFCEPIHNHVKKENEQEGEIAESQQDEQEESDSYVGRDGWK